MRKFIFINLLILLFFSLQLFIKVHFPLKYKTEIKALAIKYEVDASIIFAMIKVESNFNHEAKSKKGAIGVMQIMPSTAKWIVEKEKIDIEYINLYNPYQNIEIGIVYYKYLDKRYNGNIEKILAGYNAGVSRVENESWKNIEETKYYVWKVKIYKIIYRILI